MSKVTYLLPCDRFETLDPSSRACANLIVKPAQHAGHRPAQPHTCAWGTGARQRQRAEAGPGPTDTLGGRRATCCRKSRWHWLNQASLSAHPDHRQISPPPSGSKTKTGWVTFRGLSVGWEWGEGRGPLSQSFHVCMMSFRAVSECLSVHAVWYSSV